jgi:hypothetical protein
MELNSQENMVVELPSYLVPDPDNGETVSSWIASMYSFTNVSRFCEITTAEMMTVQEIMVTQPKSIGICTLLNFALSTEIGPCGFLTLPPTLTEEPQKVAVIHALRRCHLWPEVYSFIGDTQPPRLPTIKMEPINGMEVYLKPSYKIYCDNHQVDTFYKSNPEDMLLPNEGKRIKKRMGSLIYIPTVWIPAFTEPLLPNQARQRVMELCHMMPKSSQYLFEEIMEWVTAACTELGGDGPDSGSSILTIPWRNVPIEHQFLVWAEGELVKLYPTQTVKQQNLG